MDECAIWDSNVHVKMSASHTWCTAFNGPIHLPWKSKFVEWNEGHVRVDSVPFESLVVMDAYIVFSVVSCQVVMVNDANASCHIGLQSRYCLGSKFLLT